jgi:hydroxymethylpyrimidine kinase/phosphomethylpyrimidine kinase
VGALYPGIERGLSADLIAARALNGQAFPVCTSLVVAGNGVVTDVLDVPTDSIDAQLEHLFETQRPTAAKVGIVNHPATIDMAFDHLAHHLNGPLVLDMTLSGPSGEDVIGQRGIEALTEHMAQPDLVTLRLRDASLIAGMEIPSLDDAQVAIQRVAKLGARRVLLRCGRLPTHFFDTDSAPPDYAVDLYYDGEDFALFEAPHVAAAGTHGASSAYLLAMLKELSANASVPDAVQSAKSYVTEALRHGKKHESIAAPDYFWKWADEVSLS